MAKHLLIVYHSKTGTTRQLVDAAHQGAAEVEANVEIRYLTANEAGPNDLLWADGLILGTPENFGYMSGALKDFFDRTFYEVEGKLSPLPYMLIVSAGNDGTGAARAIRRIAPGYPLIESAPVQLCIGEPGAEDLVRSKEMGMTMSAGLDIGMF